jgi:hypothetical protein
LKKISSDMFYTYIIMKKILGKNNEKSDFINNFFCT